MKKYHNDDIDFKRMITNVDTKNTDRKLRCYKCSILFTPKELSSHIIQCSLRFPMKINIFYDW